MKHVQLSVYLSAVFSAFSLFCLTANGAPEASPTPEEILTKMEATINGFQDQQMDVTMTIVDTDGSRKSYDNMIYQKGDVKRYIIFTSGENKGMATLIEDPSHIYVYLPGFKKVRRVAAHNMNQTFAGSDFSNEDMAMVSWTKTYDVKLEKEDPDYWYLLATPKAGLESQYSKVIIKIDKKTYIQMMCEYFNKAGEKVKVFTMADIKDYNGVKRASKVVLADPRTKHSTELLIKDFKVNQGLKDDMFTVRQLQWGGK